MQARILAENLVPALQQAAGVVGKESPQDQLHVAAAGDSLLIRGINPKLNLEVQAVAEDVQQEGACTLPAKKITDIVRSLPVGTEIQLTHNPTDHSVTAKAGRSRFTLAGLEPDSMPFLHIESEDFRFDVDAASFLDMIKRGSIATANDDVRYYLNGTLLKMGGGQSEAVSTDGHRLVHIHGPGVDGEFQGIIPSEASKALERHVGGVSESMTVSGNAYRVRFEASGVRMVVNLVDGRYPDYHRVIPQRATQQAQVDRQEMVDCLKRVSTLANQKTNGIQLDFAPDGITVTAENPGSEQAQEQIDVTYEGDPVSVGFNVNYLLDALKTIKDEYITFSIGGSQASTLIEPASVGRDSERHVLMPMRL